MMEIERITIKFVDGKVVVPEENLKILEEAAKHPIKYTKECPKLTKKQLSGFVRHEDFLRDRENEKKQLQTIQKTSIV